MNFEPQKLFFGLMDFFSIMLPGAVFTWVLMGHAGQAVFGSRYADLSGAAGWAVFLFVSYLLGHLGFLLGSWLDQFHDRARRHTLKAQIGVASRWSRLLSWSPKDFSGWCSSASAPLPLHSPKRSNGRPLVVRKSRMRAASPPKAPRAKQLLNASSAATAAQAHEANIPFGGLIFSWRQAPQWCYFSQAAWR